MSKKNPNSNIREIAMARAQANTTTQTRKRKPIADRSTSAGPGRPRLEQKLVKDRTVTLRMNEQQNAYIERAREIVQTHLKVEVTKTWVIMTLCELGMPAFEKKYGIKKVS